MSVTIHPQAQAQIRATMRQVLAEIAFAVEAEAKHAAPVDTGFLRATIQAIPPAAAGTAAHTEARADRTYTAAASRGAGADEALVVVAAAYAYWVETRTPFLVPAALAVAAEVGAIVRRHRG